MPAFHDFAAQVNSNTIHAVTKEGMAMINTEDEVRYDLRSSCTEEEAAAMMLGWLRGEKRARYIQVTLDGISPDQFPHMLSLPDTLEATIHEQREKASIEFHNAVVNEEFSIAEAKEAIVEGWDRLAKRARRYMIDIGDELTRSDSALRIDQPTTIATGVTHITLKSLDQWSRKEFGIAILDDEPDVSDLAPASKEPPPLAQPINPGLTPHSKPRRFDALAAELDEILQKASNLSPSIIMAELRGRIGSENTCVTANVGDGIQWETGSGDVKTLTIGALTERIRVWKKRRLSQG